MKKSEYIYWDTGEFIGKNILHKRNDTEAVMKDGRVVHKINGKWIYKGE